MMSNQQEGGVVFHACTSTFNPRAQIPKAEGTGALPAKVLSLLKS